MTPTINLEPAEVFAILANTGSAYAKTLFSSTVYTWYRFPVIPASDAQYILIL